MNELNRLSVNELYANDCENALELECMAIYVMDELCKREKSNKQKQTI